MVKSSDNGGSSTGIAGDGGLGWLKKSLKRCEQQAEEQGRTLDEVAAERYGVRIELLFFIEFEKLYDEKIYTYIIKVFYAICY